MSAPVSHKLIWSDDGRPSMVSGNPARGYIVHDLLVLPGWWHLRSHEAVSHARHGTPVDSVWLAEIIERALDDAIAAGVEASDTEMLGDHVAEALRSLPALMTDWEAS